MITLSPVELVLRATAVTEGIEEVGGANRGRAVERIQKRTGNRAGDAWCASYVADVGSAMLREQWPLPRTASCDHLLEHARKRGMLSPQPLPGAVFLVMKTPTDAIHTGFVTELLEDGFATIEGNTNPAGGREGYGVFRRKRGHRDDRAKYAFIHWWAP